MKRFILFMIISTFLILTCKINAQWTQTNGLHTEYVDCIIVSGNNLFAGTEKGVFISTDEGMNWKITDSSLSIRVWSLAFSSTSVGTYIFAGTSDGVYISINSGSSWAKSNSGPIGRYVWSLTVSQTSDGTSIFAGTNNGIYRSSDNASTWMIVDSGLISSNPDVEAIMAVPIKDSSSGITRANIFAATGTNVCLSENNGNSWSYINSGLPGNPIISLAYSGSVVYAGVSDLSRYVGKGVFISTNNDTDWASAGLSNFRINCLAAIGNNVFAGFNGQLPISAEEGVALSTNNGSNWTEINLGLSDTTVLTLALSESYLYAGTYSGVWRRPLSELITGTKELENKIPSGFTLNQNYPNPFNPSTTIQYAIPKSGHVMLKVYNVLGKEVATLVNENKAAGEYNVSFNGSNLASGIYFYRITAGSFTDTKKLILLK